MTPEEAWSGNKPDVSRLRIFGSRAFVHIPNMHCDKLAAKSLVCTFLRHVTLAVSSDKQEVDGCIRVGPNKWMRCGDIMNDVV